MCSSVCVKDLGNEKDIKLLSQGDMENQLYNDVSKTDECDGYLEKIINQMKPFR